MVNRTAATFKAPEPVSMLFTRQGGSMAIKVRLVVS